MTNSPLCKYCGSTSFDYNVKLIEPNQWVKEHVAKFVPQIGQYCTSCGRWIKWAEQTPELIAKFNQKLEPIRLEGFECV